MTKTDDVLESRRTFLRYSIAAGFAGAYVIIGKARGAEAQEVTGPPVSCALVGLGLHGRRLVSIISRMPTARVAAYCDTYEAHLNRGRQLAPEAAAYRDVRAMLEGEKAIEAVIIATPTHKHRQAVEPALEAGKHVYCEAPLASTLEDARAIHEAAARSRTLFAAGLQIRSNPHYDHSLKFLKVSAIGSLVSSHSQFHVNTSWRRAVSDPEFREELNWRLSPEVSLGLLGEAGVHSFDTLIRATNSFPSAVTSFGSITKWNDGRTTPDTVHCVLEFPSGFRAVFAATLANSYGGQSDTLHGTHGSMLLAEKRCWMFKEADAPSLGWEVYARRERVATQDGIVLVANATKLLEQAEMPGAAADKELENAEDPFQTALADFMKSIRTGGKPAAGSVEGYRSALLAIMAKRSLIENRRIEIDPQMAVL